MSSHPYKNLPESSFWRPSVAERNMFEISNLWKPKFGISQSMRVATYGSCFAQHIGRSLKERGFAWVNCEPAPAGLSEQNRKKYNYNVFSARTGNIYTASILRQWAEWATGKSTPPSEIWEQDGRFIDPFRPTIEPNGFSSKEEVIESRMIAIESFRQSILSSDIFVFTLGLTESWFNEAGYEYPLCPGTAGGEFDPNLHKFVNQDYNMVRENLIASFSLIASINKNIKFLLTVSPVPLVATNANRHVLVSTMASKSILRAVADNVSGMRFQIASSEQNIVSNGEMKDGSDWTIFGEHKLSPGEISLVGPSPNPFRGVWQKLSKPVQNGDQIKIILKTDPGTKMDVSISPERNTRRAGKRVVRIADSSTVEIDFAPNWSGDAYLWIGSGDPLQKFRIGHVSGLRTTAEAGVVDYFPSYEIINSPAFGGVFFEGNKREVSLCGVNFVMSRFFNGIGFKPESKTQSATSEFDVICDEVILGKFEGAAP